MNKKIKSILSYIGVACLGALVGIGALVGVSSCSNNLDRAETTIKDKATRKNSIITPSADTLSSDNIYYFEIKNYENKGEGYLWEDTMNINYSAIGSFDAPFEVLYADFDLINGSTIQKKRLAIQFVQNGGVYRLSSITLYNQESGSTGGNFIYYVDSNGGLFNRTYCAFLLKNFDRVNNDYLYYFVNRFFNVYQLQSDTYTLNDTINPYTWWNVDANSPYTSYITFVSGAITQYKTISLPHFYVGGLGFDSIRFYYNNVSAGDHFSVDGEQFIYSGNDNLYMTFDYASFYNTATQYEVPFYAQEVSFGAYGYNGKTYLCSHNYYDLNLKDLQFFESPSQSVLNNLNQLNNTYQSVGYHTTSDVGLGNVFSLLTMAFACWVPIFSIQIVPGITIGLLLFMPLIAGIIVLIIWIVKR